MNAKEHIIGHAISNKDEYRTLDIESEYEVNDANQSLQLMYKIDENIHITATPGHTLDSISIIVANSNMTPNTVAICGDLFEKREDCFDQNIWMQAGSESVDQQRKSRHRIAELADIIVPGHGTFFSITDEIRNKLKDV